MVSMARFLFLIFLCCSSQLVAAADITVSSDRNPVALNESFTLVFTATGSVDDDPDFSPLRQYLDILGQSQSSNISIINGSMSRKKTWQLSVMAKQTGKIELPPIQFGKDSSQAYSLTVNKAAVATTAQQAFFTRVKVDQEQVYPQQQLVIRQQLYTSQNLSGYALGDLQFSGVDVETKPLGDEKRYQTQVAGKTYLVIEQAYAVFAQQPGLLNIDPSLVEGRLYAGSQSRFDPFGSFGSIPGLSSGKLIRAQSDPVTVAILPLPGDAATPWLPAHDLQIEQQWSVSSLQIMQGEPITRTLSLKAEGLTAAQLPVLPVAALSGVKQYPDQPLLNDVENDSGVTGYRVEKTALIANQPGKLVLPAINIPWWDTDEQQSKMLEVPAVTLTVLPAPGQAVAPVTPPVAEPAELIPQSADNNDTEQAVTPAVAQTNSAQQKNAQLWIYATWITSVGWLLTLLAWWLSHRINRQSQHRVEPAATPVLLNARQAYSELKQACKQSELKQIKQALLNWMMAWNGQSTVPPSAIIRQLSPLLADYLQQIDQTLYAANSSPAELDCKLMLQEIDRIMKTGKSAKTSENTLEPLVP